MSKMIPIAHVHALIAKLDRSVDGIKSKPPVAGPDHAAGAVWAFQTTAFALECLNAYVVDVSELAPAPKDI